MELGPIRLDDATLLQVEDWRHDIHKHPEMAFEENRTSAIVAKELSNMGYEVTTGIAKTGLVAVMEYGPGPSIAIRADMDALPISEQNDVTYASQHAGCMHACGHDGHTAMLLGAARELANREDLSGTLHLVFQPAEENEGGARAMIEDGLLDKFPIQEIYGLHNMPGVEVGTYQVCSGPLLASFDKFEIEIVGAGGHGAWPHQARDSILAASALNMSLNSIVARDISPQSPGVVTVGHFEAIGSYNVIPESVRLLGSCRAHDMDTRARLKERVTAVCRGIAESYQVEVNLNYEEGYPPVVNDERCAEFVTDALIDLVGEDKVQTQFEKYMGSEDFAFYLEKVPGCFFILGNGSNSGPIHSPTYNFNDEASQYGVAAWVRVAEKALKSSPPVDPVKK